jgi:chromosome partitioning protein
VIAVAMQKGGVGKTTTAVNLGVCLAQGYGKKVLVVDSDPQANATLNLGVSPEGLDRTIYDVAWREVSVWDCIRTTKYLVDLLPSGEDLYGLEMDALENPDVFPQWRRILAELLAPVRERYDYVLVDLPPSLGVLTVNGLVAADRVLVPLQCEYFATRGVKKLLDTLQRVKAKENQRLEILGVLLTMYQTGTVLASQVAQDARKYFGGLGIRVFETTIYRTVKFSEATALRMPAVIAARGNQHVAAYHALAEEVVSLEPAQEAGKERSVRGRR